MTPTEVHPVFTERLTPAAVEVRPEQAVKRSPWLMHLFPSFTDIAFLFPLVFLFGRLDGVRTMLGDGDTGWHVLTGQWILAHHQVPHQDIFSFTKAGQPWFAWEWLWDVAFAWIYGHGGLGSVVLASLVVIWLDLCAAVPADGAAVRESAGGDRRDFAGDRGIVDSLAGASASVLHAVHGDFFNGARPRSGRPH